MKLGLSAATAALARRQSEERKRRRECMGGEGDKRLASDDYQKGSGIFETREAKKRGGEIETK
jgi:hypothetical protein